MKFNDYFEFPREFDMAPYTANTLAKLEGKLSNGILSVLSASILPTGQHSVGRDTYMYIHYQWLPTQK